MMIICSLFLINRTRSPLRDVFTTGRISILKDKPANVTRDIIIDMSNLYMQGGILTLTQSLMMDIARKRPNWRLSVLIPKKAKRLITSKVLDVSSHIVGSRTNSKQFWFRFPFLNDKLPRS